MHLFHGPAIGWGFYLDSGSVRIARFAFSSRTGPGVRVTDTPIFFAVFYFYTREVMHQKLPVAFFRCY